MSDEKTTYEGRFERKYLRDACLFVQAFVWLVFTRLSLAVSGYVKTAKLIGDPAGRIEQSGSAKDDTYRYRIAWAVSKASRIVRYDRPCLAQALVLRYMLSRRGQTSELRIGVKKNDDASLRAHAWVEKDGEVLIGGGSSPYRYTILTPEDRIDL